MPFHVGEQRVETGEASGQDAGRYGCGIDQRQGQGSTVDGGLLAELARLDGDRARQALGQSGFECGHVEIPVAGDVAADHKGVRAEFLEPRGNALGEVFAERPVDLHGGCVTFQCRVGDFLAACDGLPGQALPLGHKPARGKEVVRDAGLIGHMPELAVGRDIVALGLGPSVLEERRAEAGAKGDHHGALETFGAAAEVLAEGEAGGVVIEYDRLRDGAERVAEVLAEVDAEHLLVLVLVRGDAADALLVGEGAGNSEAHAQDGLRAGLRGTAADGLLEYVEDRGGVGMRVEVLADGAAGQHFKGGGIDQVQRDVRAADVDAKIVTLHGCPPCK